MTFAVTRSALLGAAILLTAGCGERNNPFGSGSSGSDRTPPTVVSTIPANFATQAGLSSPIVVTFSEPMAMSSFTTAALTFSPGVTGTLSYSGNTATFTPTTALVANTTYTVTVTTVVEDRTGNNLAAPYTWSFTTGPTQFGIVE